MTTNKKIAGILGTALIAIAAWFFISPLFIDNVVDEAFVFSSSESMPTRSDLKSMPPKKRVHMINSIMDEMATHPDNRVDEEIMTMASPAIISHGKFTDADAIHQGKGEVVVYRLQDGSHVVRFEDFHVTNGPDLVVYLAKHPTPSNAADVKQGYLELASLKGNSGNQNYIISAGTDISEFGSVVIWCDLFDVLFSPARLIEP